MDPNRIAVPLSTFVFFLLGIVLPLVRHYNRTGELAIVSHRDADPFQRFVGLAFSLAIAASGAWGVAYGALGPDRLGVWSRPAWLAAVGWTIDLVGVVIIVAGQAQMGLSWRIGIDDRPTALVATGLYRWGRNPIYTGVLIMLAGLVLIAPGAWTIMGWLHIAFILGVQTRLEEQHMLKLHGDAYREYASKVRRFVP